MNFPVHIFVPNDRLGNKPEGHRFLCLWSEFLCEIFGNSWPSGWNLTISRMCLSCAQVVPMDSLRSLTWLELRLDDMACCCAQLRGNLDFLGTKIWSLANACLIVWLTYGERCLSIETRGTGAMAGKRPERPFTVWLVKVCYPRHVSQTILCEWG